MIVYKGQNFNFQSSKKYLLKHQHLLISVSSFLPRPFSLRKTVHILVIIGHLSQIFYSSGALASYIEPEPQVSSFHTDLHRILKEETNSNKEDPTSKPAIFISSSGQSTELRQEIARRLLKVDLHGNEDNHSEPFPEYIFTPLEEVEDFSYAERLSHYTFHHLLFNQGVLPVDLITLKNVALLVEKSQSSFDAHQTARGSTPVVIRKLGRERRVLEEQYFDYVMQVQSQSSGSQTLAQFQTQDQWSRLLDSESLSTLILSHLLTGIKAEAKEYQVSKEGKLVLPASLQGMKPVIAQSVGGLILQQKTKQREER